MFLRNLHVFQVTNTTLSTVWCTQLTLISWPQIVQNACHSYGRLSKIWICLFIFRHVSLTCCLFFLFSRRGAFFPLTLSLFLPHLVLFWSFVYQAFWRSWLTMGWAYIKYSEPDFNFFSPLKRTKSEYFCGQIREQISRVKIRDAPPKSELLASLPTLCLKNLSCSVRSWSRPDCSVSPRLVTRVWRSPFLYKATWRRCWYPSASRA